MAQRQEEQMRVCGKILSFLMAHKDAAPFLEPVKWKEWGLVDYPRIVKNPMDLGLVKKKYDEGQYTSVKEFKHDVNLVWSNCMMYNTDGSEYYMIAKSLQRIFEEKFSKLIRDDDDAGAESVRQPTLVDKKMLSQNIYNISSEDLGRVVQMLDQRCEACIKKIDPEDIEIDIDAIDAATFWAVDAFVKDSLPGAKARSSSTGAAKKPKAVGVAAPAAASASDGLAGPSKTKKPRTSVGPGA